MHATRYEIDLTVNSSGAATAYTSGPVNGRVLQLRYVPDGTSPLDTGADLTITGEVTGVAIATLTNIGTNAFTKVPRQSTHGATGTALVYAASDPVAEPVYLAGERVKVVVAQGGTSKIGTLYVWVG